MAALAKVTSSVDDRLRPLIRLRILARDDEALATVDTGFNGQLMMTDGDARRWRVTLLDNAEKVELGHGLQVDVQLGEVDIMWMERKRRATVFISERSEPTRDGEPVVLIGTSLLTPHLLLVDFEARTVEIETQ